MCNHKNSCFTSSCCSLCPEGEPTVSPWSATTQNPLDNPNICCLSTLPLPSAAAPFFWLRQIVPKGARQMRFQCSEIVILAKRHSSTSAFFVSILADLWALETFVHHQVEIVPKFIQGQSFLFHIVLTRCKVLFHLLPGTLHGGRAYVQACTGSALRNQRGPFQAKAALLPKRNSKSAAASLWGTQSTQWGWFCRPRIHRFKILSICQRLYKINIRIVV